MINASAKNNATTVIPVCMMVTVPSSITMRVDLSMQSLYVFDCTQKKDKIVTSSTVLNNYSVGKIVDIAMLINLEKINSIARFQSNWDGNDAFPFSSDTIEFFRFVIKNLNKQPDIAPTAANSLLLQYSREDGSMLYYNLYLDKTERVLLPNGEITQAEEKVYSNEDNLIAIINNDVENLYGSRKN